MPFKKHHRASSPVQRNEIKSGADSLCHGMGQSGPRGSTSSIKSDPARGEMVDMLTSTEGRRLTEIYGW